MRSKLLPTPTGTLANLTDSLCCLLHCRTLINNRPGISLFFPTQAIILPELSCKQVLQTTQSLKTVSSFYCLQSVVLFFYNIYEHFVASFPKAEFLLPCLLPFISATKSCLYFCNVLLCISDDFCHNYI